VVIYNDAFEQLSVSQAIESFFLFAKVEGRSHRTFELYEYVFEKLKLFLSENQLDAQNIQAIDADIIRSFILWLREKRYSDSTISIHFRVLKTFIGFLVSDNYLKENPFNYIKQPKQSKQFPPALSPSQLKAFYITCKKQTGTWYGFRTLIVILTLLDTGMRIGELTSLTLESLSLNQHCFQVVGKGSKERNVYFGRKLSRNLKHWLKLRTLSLDGEYLFCTREGGKLNRRNFNRTLSRLAEQAGLGDVKVCPHVFRHTFGTEFIRNGGDPFSLQQLLGHSDISTTMIYVHMVGKTLQEAYIRSSPLDHMQREG